MQVINRSKFADAVRSDPQLTALLADFLETLPRALSALGSNLQTPQMLLQHYLESSQIAVNVPTADDWRAPDTEPCCRFCGDATGENDE